MKKVLSTIILAILVLSMFGAIAPAVRAGTAGTFTTSTTQFIGNSLVELRVVDPDLNLNASTYDTLQVTYVMGTNTTALTLNETLPNSGEFICYIKNQGSTLTPAAAPYGTHYPVYALQNGTTLPLVAGDTFTLTYNDQSPVQSTTITMTYDYYDAAAADMTFDRASGQYPMNGYIRINVHDLNWNFDPTTANTISLNWSVVDPVNGTTNWINATFTETDVNTAVFRLETSYNTTNNFAYAHSLFVNDGDAVKFTYLNSTATTAPFKYITMQTFSRTLTVASTFTASGGIALTVSDPNFDQKSWSKENLGAYGATSVNVTTDDGVDLENVTALLKESDYSSGTFTYTLPVVIGTVVQNDGTLQLDPYDYAISIKYYANGTLKSETSTTLSTTAATIASDKTQYRATATPTLTLTAPDLNYDAQNVNFFTCVFPGATVAITSIQVFENTQNVGNMSVKVGSLASLSLGAQTLTFVESGVNTGIFTASLDLTKVGTSTGAALGAGDTVQVDYKDLINGVTNSVTFTIGVPTATVALDRSTYPVPAPAIGAITFYPTVTDSDANTNVNTIQNTGTKFWYVVYASNGSAVAQANTVLYETGANTGVFDAGIAGIPFGPVAASQTAMTNGWIKLFYLDPASGENVTTTAQLTVNDGSLSVDKSSVQAGDVITITVTEPDLNRDSAAKNLLPINYDYTDQAGTELTNMGFNLRETGVNTGVFTGTITIGKPYSVVSNAVTLLVSPGTTMTIRYADWTPSYVTAALPNFPTTSNNYTSTINVRSFTGTIVLDKSEYGIGSLMSINVTDPDLNIDTTATEIYTGAADKLVLVRVSGLADNYTDITETNVSSPVFTNISWFNWAVDPTLIGKAFQVYYKDVADADGNTVYAYASGVIKAWDAVVTFDKQYYSVGDVAVVTVDNMDSNTNPSMIQTIQATVTSDHDPVGQTITCTETGANTGIFSGNIQISSSIATGKVYAQVGDTLTAKFTDPYPAAYVTNGNKAADFTGTAIVGVPVSRPVPASGQAFVDPNTGATVTGGTVGTAVGLQAAIENVDVVSKPFTAIFQVKDPNGVVIFISWVSGTLTAGQSLTQAVSWTPSVAGSYTVEVLVVKSLSVPTPYSDKLSSTLAVA